MLGILVAAGCYKGYWDGYTPRTPLEAHAEKACGCLHKEVKKAGVSSEELVELGLKLRDYRDNGLPAGVSQASVDAEFEKFSQLREKARAEFVTFRSIRCVEDVMREVQLSGQSYFELGKVVGEHCYLAQVFAEE